jgi:hypothetical protein
MVFEDYGVVSIKKKTELTLDNYFLRNDGWEDEHDAKVIYK